MQKFLRDSYIAAATVSHDTSHLASLGLVVCYRTCHDIDYSDEVNFMPNAVLDSVIIYHVLLFFLFNIISKHYFPQGVGSHRIIMKVIKHCFDLLHNRVFFYLNVISVQTRSLFIQLVQKCFQSVLEYVNYDTKFRSKFFYSGLQTLTLNWNVTNFAVSFVVGTILCVQHICMMTCENSSCH